MPVRDAGCGIGVSVGGRVGVTVGVNVGDGTGVSVDVGATVADGSIAVCPLQAVNSTAKNKSNDENCKILIFIFFPDDLILQEASQRFALPALGRGRRSRPARKMTRRRKLLEIATESPASGARFVSRRFW